MRCISAAFVFCVTSSAPAAGAGLETHAAETWLERLAGRGFSGAVLAIDDDEVVVERAFGLADGESGTRMTTDTVFDVGSITKQFTAAAVMLLEQQGRLDVGDTLSQYFDAAPADKADITLQQLLTHSAGLAGGLGHDEHYVGTDDFVALALSSPLLFEPGTDYAYSNVGFSLLGIIVEQLGGMGYEQYLRDHFFLPLGMTDTGYVLPKWERTRIACCYQDGRRWGLPIDKGWHADGPGWHLRANGGMMTTLADMRRWIGSLGDATILDEDHCAALFQPRVREGEGADTFYGYGWSVFPSALGGQIRTHNGGNGILSADLWWHPSRGRLIFTTSTHNEWVADDVREGILDFLNGQPRPLPAVAREVDPAELQAACGVYRAEEATFELSATAGVLTALPGNWQAFAWLSDPAGTDFAAQRAAVAATESLAAAMREGDFSGLAAQASVHSDPAGFADRIASIFAERVAEAGEWRAHEILGPAPADDALVVWVRFEQARDTAFVGFRWQGESLTGMALRERAPRFAFHPIAGGAFESFSLRAGDALAVPVRLELASEAGELRLFVCREGARKEFVRETTH